MKNLINKTLNWIKENKKKTILGVGLTALLTTTALKDNVHFESVQINNPQENHYVWGIIPTTTITGKDGKGKIRTFGLIYGASELENDSELKGDAKGYGLIFGRGRVGNNSNITGDAKGYGLIGGGGDVGNNSNITGDVKGYGLISGVGDVGNNSNITGDAKGYGLSFGVGKVGNNSNITGDLISKGLFSYNSITGFKLFSSSVIGLKNYVVKQEKK